MDFTDAQAAKTWLIDTTQSVASRREARDYLIQTAHWSVTAVDLLWNQAWETTATLQDAHFVLRALAAGNDFIVNDKKKRARAVIARLTADYVNGKVRATWRDIPGELIGCFLIETQHRDGTWHATSEVLSTRAQAINAVDDLVPFMK